MTIDRRDLTALTDSDLALLLEAFRALASQKNRVALDLFAIVEKEMLTRYQSTKIADYTDDDLANTVTALASAVDTSRANGIDDDYPTMRFLLLNLTVFIDEMERRGTVKEIQ